MEVAESAPWFPSATEARVVFPPISLTSAGCRDASNGSCQQSPRFLGAPGAALAAGSGSAPGFAGSVAVPAGWRRFS